jgi:hypothetical protein
MSEAPPTVSSFTIDHVPAPVPGSEAETLAPAPGTAALPEQVPGYDILGVLGRGGMGVVYQARHQRLNRLVALKMILAGGRAGEAERARFRTEAEAVARLRHAGIVQIYDVGEHAGLPYLALEYCDGGSLAGRLGGTPLTPAQAAALVEQLARAVGAAHQQQVIHRDLKPANVLLAADGTPKVTDFGLAKKLDEAGGQTQTGAILGTPSYMTPEQAGGKGKQVGPAADVYALGAILYECLTGRPPFKAATTMDTVFQVLSDEPVPPTQLQPKTPRDLETICLKCLQKEPVRRFATAADLAEDLRRFQAGEPIAARPVGSIERAVKWARRRPAAAALLLSLVLGTAVSTYFAVQARRRAHDAENSEGRARVEQKKSTEAYYETEEILARILLRPLNHEGSVTRVQLSLVHEEAILNDNALEDLWELAQSPSDRLHRQFLEYALERPARTQQLRNRREFSVHAAVGLDPARRQWLGEGLLQRLKDETSESPWREDCAFVALEITRPGQELTREAARQLADALFKEADATLRCRLAGALVAVAGRLEPAEQALLCAGAARSLADALAKEKEVSARRKLAGALVAVAARLEPAGATQLLADALDKESNPAARHELVKSLVAMAARLEPAMTARLIADALAKETDPHGRYKLAEALGAVAARLEPAVASVPAQKLAEALTKEIHLYTTYMLVDALGAVAARLEPAEKSSLARSLADALAKDTNSFAQFGLARALGAVAERLEPAEAAQPCAGAVRQLVDALKKATDLVSRRELAGALGAVAARLEPVGAAQLLAGTLDKERAASAQLELVSALVAVAARLGPAEVSVLARQFAGALRDVEKTPNVKISLALHLEKLAARLEPAEAAALARSLAEALAEETDSVAQYGLAQALGAVAIQLEPAEAARLCAGAARQLADALAKETNPKARSRLVQAQASLAARPEPAGAVRLLVNALDTTAPSERYSLARALGELTARLEPAGATQLLADALDKETNPSARHELVKALVAMATRVEPAMTARLIAEVSRRLADDLTKVTNPSERTMLAESLVAVAARLEQTEATALARLLPKALAKEADSNARSNLARALGAIAGRLGPAEALALAQMLPDALAKEMDRATRSQLIRALGAVAARIEPEEVVPRSLLAARAVSSWMSLSPQLGNAGLLLQAAEPIASRFGTQQLVDLLKMPTCVGEARTVILEQLSNRYKRPFADVWEFVEWAEKNEPGLDFKSPPKRNPLR